MTRTDPLNAMWEKIKKVTNDNMFLLTLDHVACLLNKRHRVLPALILLVPTQVTLVRRLGVGPGPPQA